jgi:hypothetical protein
MEDLDIRLQRAVKELAGNEALLEMLDTDAAAEMLEWGKTLLAGVVEQTADLDDEAAEIELAPRLKAVRQFMRSTGNWAAGKYTDPESRTQLREKLLGHLFWMREDLERLPSAEAIDEILNQVDDPENTQLQLILNMKEFLHEPR